MKQTKATDSNRHGGKGRAFASPARAGEKPSQSPWGADYTSSPYLAFLIGAALFIMFVMSFPRLDDLTWGSSMGLDRLHSWFAGYNGRYVGNLIVILLTRLPTWLRALVELSVLGGIFYLAYGLLPGKGSFCFFVLAFLTLPLELHAQALVWTAGFANYTTAAAVLLFELYICHRLLIRKESLSKSLYLVFFVVCLLGQMIVENLAIYSVLLIGAALLYAWSKGEKKVLPPILAALILAVSGTATVFLNSSYGSALAHDGGNYKTISLSLPDLWGKFEADVVPWLVQKNHLLNLALSVVLLLLWLTRNARGKSAVQNRLGCFFGAALSAFFCYDMLDSSWSNVVTHGKTIYAILALFYGAYIIITILANTPDPSSRLTLLTLALSQLALAGPLVPASPLTARCFFLNGILWCLLLAALLQLLLIRLAPRFDRTGTEKRIVRVTQLISLFYLIFVLCAQSQSWHIQALRMEITQSSLQQGAQAIVLPRVPWSGTYAYGANIGNDNAYWLANYKRYYEIPEDIQLEFMDYDKWCEQFGKN